MVERRGVILGHREVLVDDILSYKIFRNSYCTIYSEIIANNWDDKQLDYKVNTGEYND